MKRALIIFPDPWLPYSPTILNFITCLEQYDYEVDIIAVDSGLRSEQLKRFEKATILEIDPKFMKIMGRIKIYRAYILLGLLIKTIKVKKGKKYALVLGVDSIGFLCAHILFKAPIFISLEIQNDLFFYLAKLSGIRKMVIQSEERKKFLLGSQSSTEVFYIQNSPIHSDTRYLLKKKHINNVQYKLLYFGNIIPSHGVEQCIESLYYLDEKYSLYLKGLLNERYKAELIEKYNMLFQSKRLILDEDYIEQSEVIEFINQFDIGFCFYNIENEDFNYVSCPSGKLYNYYEAGVPVIASRILGLVSVEEDDTGILLDTPSPVEIAKAVDKINDNYSDYSINCRKASEKYDFNYAFQEFMKSV
jgi:glycosyltransferase involved in cell wall biosynthesis